MQLADAAALRYHFNRSVGTTPTAYRRTFRTRDELDVPHDHKRATKEQSRAHRAHRR
jgi:hypothetical protein